MLSSNVLNPAEQAASEAMARVYACIDQRKSFLLEAGAGAGKTYSLINALRYLIEKDGIKLLRQHQRIACITFTNVAKDEIQSRTDRHPAVYTDTVHAFCWSVIRDFQLALRQELPKLDKWAERLVETGGLCTVPVEYDLGYPTVEKDRVLLHHDDVLALTVLLMEQVKFRILFVQRFPILLIDEYQDTDSAFAAALVKHFFVDSSKLLIGFFGDHWQKIYGSGCGRIEHFAIEVIGKEANFRSVPAVIDVLNRMRPMLPQAARDATAVGFAGVFHTNNWRGPRRPKSRGGHWEGDLPADVSHRYLDALRDQLSKDGWDFSPSETKILMLTHNILAVEQGYKNLADVFSRNEAYIKKENACIAFFLDTVEPMCLAYEKMRFGEMFAVLGSKTPIIHNHADKTKWSDSMDKLLVLRATGTVGAVLDHFRTTRLPRLPDAIQRQEKERELWESDNTSAASDKVEQLRKLRNVSYSEVVALARFVEGYTPFATKHGVKGAEFENVLVVLGRGWNQYDFSQMLEMAHSSKAVPSDIHAHLH